MTTLNTTEDLLRAARQNREFREAFRREILTEDLIDSPREIKELKEMTGSLVEGIAALVQGMADYRAATDARLERIEGSVSRVEGMVRDMVGDVAEVRNSHRAEHDALDRFRGNYAIDTTRNNDSAIAGIFTTAFGIDRFRLRDIPREERDDLYDDNEDAIERLDTEGDTNTSFPTADLILEASRGRTRTVLLYVAVEASYTIEAKDVIRASDNAKLLRAIAGVDAFAVVSGVTLDSRLSDHYRQRIIHDPTEYIESEDAGAVLWFQLDDRSMEPVPPC